MKMSFSEFTKLLDETVFDQAELRKLASEDFKGPAQFAVYVDFDGDGEGHWIKTYPVLKDALKYAREQEEATRICKIWWNEDKTEVVKSEVILDWGWEKEGASMNEDKNEVKIMRYIKSYGPHVDWRQLVDDLMEDFGLSEDEAMGYIDRANSAPNLCERGGFVRKLSNGCKLMDMGDVFVVTDPNGKNIGQCRTEIEAEVIADEYGNKKVNEKRELEVVSVDKFARGMPTKDGTKKMFVITFALDGDKATQEAKVWALSEDEAIQALLDKYDAIRTDIPLFEGKNMKKKITFDELKRIVNEGRVDEDGGVGSEIKWTVFKGPKIIGSGSIEIAPGEDGLHKLTLVKQGLSSMYGDGVDIKADIYSDDEKDVPKEPVPDVDAKPKSTPGGLKNPDIKEGDILVSSWGYSMTIVNFYKVISRKATSTLIVRELAQKPADDKTSMGYYGHVLPVEDKFISGPKTARINKYGQVKIVGGYDSERMSKWDGKPMFFDKMD